MRNARKVLGFSMVVVLVLSVGLLGCPKKTEEPATRAEAEELIAAVEKRLADLNDDEANMYASASYNQAKNALEAAKEALEYGEYAEAYEKAERAMDKLDRVDALIQAKGKEEDVEDAVREEEMGGVISLKRIYFDFDQFVLRDDAKKILRNNAQQLLERMGVSVVVEGHCDDRGTNEYNLALGERRANSVKKYLVNLGVKGSRISTISYGEEQPLDVGSNEAAWAKNRRADLSVQ